MSKARWWWWLVVLLVFVPGTAGAQVRLVLPEIEGLITTDGSGTYQKILAEAAARAHLNYTSEVFPRARALEAFFDDGYDGIFTFTQTARDRLGADQIIASYPFGAYRGYVFTGLGAPAVDDFTVLKGRAVGGVLGFEGTYGAVQKAGAVLELVSTDDQNLKKLAAGRIEAFLGFLPDLYPETPRLSFAPDHPFFEAYDRLTMRNTEANLRFVEKFSTALSAMHKDGTVKAMVGKAYLPVVGDFSPGK